MESKPEDVWKNTQKVHILQKERAFKMRFLSGRMILGLVVLAVGVLWLLQNLDLVEYEVANIFAYWPLIPLIIGLNMLATTFSAPENREGRRVFISWGQLISALILIVIGVLYLGRNLDFIDESYIQQFWSALFPILLILLGLNLLRNIRGAGKGGSRVAFMGGFDLGKTPWNLENGNYLAFMGGIDLDLTTAKIPEGTTVLDLTAIMGGIEVKIPRDLPVVYEGSAFLGGVSFLEQEDGGIIASRKIEHNVEDTAHKKVFIQGRAIMGGIEIKEKKQKNKVT